MKRLPWQWVALAVWGIFVFIIIFQWAFPRQRAADLVQSRVSTSTNAAFDVDFRDGLAPWIGWTGSVGVQGQTLVASKSTDAGLSPFLLADHVSVGVSVWRTLLLQLASTTHVQVGKGHLDVTSTSSLLRPRLVKRVDIDAQDLDVGDLIMLLRSAGIDLSATMTGQLDAIADIITRDGTASTATGQLSVLGDGIRVNTLSLDALGWDNKAIDLAIDIFDFRLRMEDGKLVVEHGALRTNLIEVEVSGEVVFKQPINKSEADLRFKITLPDWTDSPLAAFHGLVESGLKQGEGSDSKYYFIMKGVMGRLGLSSFEPDSDKVDGDRGSRQGKRRAKRHQTPQRLGGTLTPGRIPISQIPDIPKAQPRSVDEPAQQPRRSRDSDARAPQGARSVGRRGLIDDGFDSDIPRDDIEAIGYAEELPLEKDADNP